MRSRIILLLCCVLAMPALAQKPAGKVPALLPWSQQLAVREQWLMKRHEMILPLMRAHGIDMWIVLDREYHPDPLSVDIGGEGGVRNAAIFYDTGERLEKIYIFSHPAREDLVALMYDELINYGYRPEGLRPHLARDDSDGRRRAARS